MQSSAATPQEYIDLLPEDRKEAINKLRSTIRTHLPNGFEEVMNYGMIGYVVPHSLYPAGYHCAPAQPLPFINIASQKTCIALHHIGLYANKELYDWFVNEYLTITNKKPDIGKACMRFKKVNEIPYELIGKLATKLTPQQWITMYEQQFKK
jgi:hypothetical protein